MQQDRQRLIDALKVKAAAEETAVKRTAAATSIQAGYRGYLSRKSTKAFKDTEKKKLQERLNVQKQETIDQRQRQEREMLARARELMAVQKHGDTPTRAQAYVDATPANDRVVGKASSRLSSSSSPVVARQTPTALAVKSGAPQRPPAKISIDDGSPQRLSATALGNGASQPQNAESSRDDRRPSDVEQKLIKLALVKQARRASSNQP